MEIHDLHDVFRTDSRVRNASVKWKEERCDKSSSSTSNNFRPRAKVCKSPQKPKACSCEQWKKHKRHSKRRNKLISKLRAENCSRSNKTC